VTNWSAGSDEFSPTELARIEDLLRRTDGWMAEQDLPHALAEDRYGLDPTAFFWLDLYPRLVADGTTRPSQMLDDWTKGDWRRIVYLYFHIPFCVKRCHFCFYNISTDRSREEEYLDVLAREATAYLDKLQPGTTVGDLFFGGGTPSTVAPIQLQRLFDLVYERIDKDDIDMVTLELHPRTMRKDMHHLASSGHIRRISMGVQSFSRSAMDANGRIWVEPERIWSLCSQFRAAGVEKVGLDFMVGLHKQSVQDVMGDIGHLNRLINEGMIDSVSVYPRTFNEPSSEIAGEVIDANALLERFRQSVLLRLFFDSVGWKEGPMHLYTPKTFVPAPPSAVVHEDSTAQALGFGNSARSTFGNTNYRNIREYEDYMVATSSHVAATGAYHHLTRLETNRRYLQFATKQGVVDMQRFPSELTPEEQADLLLVNRELEAKGLIQRNDRSFTLTQLGMLVVEFIHRRYELLWVGPQFSDHEAQVLTG
jgi:oxygen-independent coproporphyrinogen III oxidase